MPAERITTDDVAAPLPGIVSTVCYGVPQHAVCPAQRVAAMRSPQPIQPPDRQYSRAVRAGNMIYTSGSVGNTKDGKLVEGTVRCVFRPKRQS